MLQVPGFPWFIQQIFIECLLCDSHKDTMVTIIYPFPTFFELKLEGETDYQQSSTLSDNITQTFNYSCYKCFEGQILARCKLQKACLRQWRSNWLRDEQVGQMNWRKGAPGRGSTGWSQSKISLRTAKSMIACETKQVLSSAVDSGNCGQLMVSRQPWVTPQPHNKRPHGLWMQQKWVWVWECLFLVDLPAPEHSRTIPLTSPSLFPLWLSAVSYLCFRFFSYHGR